MVDFSLPFFNVLSKASSKLSLSNLLFPLLAANLAPSFTKKATSDNGLPESSYAKDFISKSSSVAIFEKLFISIDSISSLLA